MKFSAPLVALVGLASMAFAAPAPAPVPIPEAAVEAGALALRDTNSASCTWNWYGDQGQAEFWISDSNGPWDDDWGTSFLAVLRQQCGVEVVQWNWWFTDNNYWETGGGYFQLSNGWSNKCVENSIWITSSGRGGAIGGVTCIWVN